MIERMENDNAIAAPPGLVTALKRWAPLVWATFVVLAIWVLAGRLRAVNAADVVRELRMQPPAIVLTAVACSAGVYLLVGIYEGLALHFVTGRRMALFALRTALIANPLGRALGAALVSGGALRYRMYSLAGLGAKQIAAVILVVAMPFVISVGWLIDLSLLLHAEQASRALRLTPKAALTLGALALVKDLAWPIFVTLRRAPVRIGGQSMRLPGLSHTIAQTFFGVAQLSLMTAILYLFMPPELDLSWPAFLSVYCIAFIAGQLSNVPAGLGVLEAALLLLLPHVPPAKLIGAVLAYRAVYELLPLLIALGLLLVFETTHPGGVVRRRRIP